ncbi:MAG: phosphatase PAP2 family protein [Verrucomicrobiota bacterium]
MSRGLRYLGLTLGGLLLLTIPFWIWPIDVNVQSGFYDSDAGWKFKESQPWDALYNFGVIPALILSIGSIVVLLLGLWKPRFARWRMISTYFVLCMIVGPGLLVNVIFKDQWGRPRPRDVAQFDGDYAYEKVLEYDASSPGKSFPCGHCTMGFYFFAVALTLGQRRRLAFAAAGGATVFGGLIGVARIVQGGHFLSDVIWGAGFCLLTSIGLFYALGLQRRLFYEPKDSSAKRAPTWALVSGVAAGIAVVLGISLATPYHRVELIEAPISDQADRFELSLILEGNEHRFVATDQRRVRLHLEGEGFGLPGSAIKHIWKTKPHDENDDEQYFQLKQRRSGYFTEINQKNEIETPANLPGYVRIEINSGNLDVDLSELKVRQTWKIKVTKPGKLHITHPDDPAAAENLKLEIDADVVQETRLTPP